MKNIVKILIFFFIYSYTTANAQSKVIKQGYEYEVALIQEEGIQGSLVFKIYSYGKNEGECIQNAKLNAIKAVIFKGIPGSSLSDPLVTEPGAEDKYRDYFNTFFQQNGKYLRFVAISGDGSIDPDDRFKVGKRLKIGVIVAVQKASLRKDLEAAGIVKRLGDGF